MFSATVPPKSHVSCNTMPNSRRRPCLLIVRVFLADPAMLIFDEATSSVDTRTEQAIAKAMAALLSHRAANACNNSKNRGLRHF